MNRWQRSPLDDLGRMPGLPPDWAERPVQTDTSIPLAKGHRWPLTRYRRVEVQDINALLGWTPTAVADAVTGGR